MDSLTTRMEGSTTMGLLQNAVADVLVAGRLLPRALTDMRTRKPIGRDPFDRMKAD